MGETFKREGTYVYSLPIRQKATPFKVIILQLKKKKEVPGSKPGAVEDVAVQVSITGLEDQMSDAGLSPTGCEEPWMF